MQNRRIFCATAAAATVALAGCDTPGGISTAESVDSKVDDAIELMHARLPYTRRIAEQASGMLVMPGIVKGGFVVGGSYGEGALRLADDDYGRSVTHYSFGSASIGFQAGFQKTSHAIFFMTPDALAGFRSRENWEIGADTEITVLDTGIKADVHTTISQRPIIAVVFSQSRLMAGASLEGAKYTPLVF